LILSERVISVTFTPETPEEMELQWDLQHPDGEHVYMEADSEGNIDPDSVTDEAPYDSGDDDEDDGDDDDGDD
jgi:hypothetical protein